MANKFILKHRRGTYEQWVSSGVVPYAGELVVELDETNNLHKLKIGDGVHNYASLNYLRAGDEIVSQVLAQTLPKIVSVTLDVDSWQKVTDITNVNVGCYGQAVVVDNIGDCGRLDLQPDVDMLAELKALGIIFVTENKGGHVTVYSVGNKPRITYTMQATIVETDLLDKSCDAIMGIPVGAPAPTTTWENIQNKPTSFYANGGNADTVGGHTVNIDVPADAKFTDTTYNPAGSELGLIKTGGDVLILDGIITVQDDSHNHIIANVDGLQEALNTKATTTYVDEKVASLVESAPEILETLDQLSAALGDDPNFATTISEQLGNKVDKIDGKGLSTNDYTDEDKAKLANIESSGIAGLSIVDGVLCVTYEEV